MSGAVQFALSDNFFLEPVSSSDGHRWLAGMYATEYQEAHWPAAYGQKRRDSGEDPDAIQNFPGRIAFSGANESAEPIDYNMHGSVFLHLTRNARTVLNFGNGIELAQVDEGAGLEPTGARERVNIPIEKVLRDNSDHLYANFNMHIPDSPLPNDHGGAPTDVEPANPWSFERFVQDNDAALGMAVELISNSPCWTTYLILGVPPLNQYDAAATDLREMFTATPDFAPYAFQPVTFVQTASAQTRAWQLATRNVDFSEMDGDEINLRAAIVQALGLPRLDARPLHETDPQAYTLRRLDALLAGWRRFGAVAP